MSDEEARARYLHRANYRGKSFVAPMWHACMRLLPCTPCTALHKSQGTPGGLSARADNSDLRPCESRVLPHGREDQGNEIQDTTGGLLARANNPVLRPCESSELPHGREGLGEENQDNTGRKLTRVDNLISAPHGRTDRGGKIPENGPGGQDLGGNMATRHDPSNDMIMMAPQGDMMDWVEVNMSFLMMDGPHGLRYSTTHVPHVGVLLTSWEMDGAKDEVECYHAWLIWTNMINIECCQMILMGGLALYAINCCVREMGVRLEEENNVNRENEERVISPPYCCKATYASWLMCKNPQRSDLDRLRGGGPTQMDMDDTHTAHTSTIEPPYHEKQYQCIQPIRLRGGLPDQMVCGDIHETDAHTEMPYHENQYKQFCHIHAINAYTGKQALQTHQVMQSAQALHQTVNKKWGAVLQGVHYQSETGNFSSMMVNYCIKQAQLDIGYLQASQRPSNNGPTTYPDITENYHREIQAHQADENYDSGIEIGSSKNQVLRRVSPHTRIILHNTVLAQGYTYGHAVCLKYHNQKWYLIDSEKPEPIDLDSIPEREGWGQVCGIIYTLTAHEPMLGALCIDGLGTNHVITQNDMKDLEMEANTHQQDMEMKGPEPHTSRMQVDKGRCYPKRSRIVVWSDESDQEEEDSPPTHKPTFIAHTNSWPTQDWDGPAPHGNNETSTGNNTRANTPLALAANTYQQGREMEGPEPPISLTHVDEGRCYPKRSRNVVWPDESDQEGEDTPHTRKPAPTAHTSSGPTQAWAGPEFSDDEKDTEITDAQEGSNKPHPPRIPAQIPLPDCDSDMGDWSDSSNTHSESESELTEEDTSDDTDSDTEDNIGEPLVIPPELIHHTHIAMTTPLMPEWWKWPGNWKGNTRKAWNQKMMVCRKLEDKDEPFSNAFSRINQIGRHHTGYDLERALLNVWEPKAPPPLELLILQYADQMQIKALTHIRQGNPSRWNVHWEPITLPNHVADEWCERLGLKELTRTPVSIEDNGRPQLADFRSTLTWAPTLMMEDDLLQMAGKKQLDRLSAAWNNRAPSQKPEAGAEKQKTYKQTLLTDYQPKKNKTEPAPNPPFQPPTLPTRQQPAAENKTEMATINCRGIRTNWESIYTAIQNMATKPEIIVLTETKLTSSSMKRMKGAISKDMNDYHLHHSSTPDTVEQTTRGRGGVILLTHKHLGPTTKVEVQTTLAGALAHVTLDQPEGHIHIMGVYMPAEEPHVRQAAYEYLRAHTTAEKTYLLVGGDWNAATHPQDRSTGILSTMDTQHSNRARWAQLYPTNQDPQNRPHTYHSYQGQTLVHSSRIDDILMYPKPQENALLTEECIQVGGTLDHHILKQMMNTPITRHQPSPAQQKDIPPMLILPISQEHRNLTRQAITLQLPTLTQLTQPIDEAYATTIAALAGNYTAANLATIRARETDKLDMETMGANIMAAIRQAHTTMLTICPKKPPLTGNFLPRQVAKEFRNQNNLAKQLKQARQAIAAQQGDMEEIKTTLLQNTNHAEAIPTIQQIPSDTTLLPQWKAQLGEQIKATISKLETIRLAQAKERSEAAQEAFRAKLSKQPRVVHRTIFGPQDKPERNLTLRDATGTLHSSTRGVLDTLTHHMQTLMAPANHTRTGKYLPQEREQANQRTPWEEDKLDPIRISTPAQELQHSTELLNILMDKCTYLNCIRHLARNKKPGPDGIPNELLMCLPDTMHTTIHKLFILMWITGQTPTCLQNSNTLSLYKKGDPTNPANYRPIGLSNTMGKLWTSLVSITLAHFSEYTGILSSAQEGFRANRGTHRQLTNLLHIIEDAALTNQDLYIAYFDFSSAFNMVDHDKLLCTMYDLGFPTDAIDTVKGIYHGATTSMVANGEQGEAISIERGTIQGDSLSPLLFLIFIEPLHRWLQAGGRGYRFGSIPRNQQDRCCTGSLGYADDTTALTHTVQDLQIQCNKVQAFSSWAGIPLNPQKCEITGILHRTSQSNPTCPTTLQALLHNHITLGGVYAKYVPPTEACMYLGIKICPTLDWKPQVQHMMEKITARGEHILTRAKPAGATPQQCLRLIKTCLIPQITYTMAVTPYMPADIDRMDVAIGAITKKCCNLPKGFPTAALRLPLEEAGLGMPSLQLEYLQVTTANLTRALNDRGTLGITTHALLHLQHQKLQELDPNQIPRQATRYLTLMRQFHILKKADVQLQVNDTPILGELKRSISKMDTLTPQHIPPALLYPLHKLGITDHTQLINREGTHLINTQELQNAWAKAGHQVTKSQKKALNRISLIVSGSYPPNCYLEEPSRYSGVEPLPACCRKLPQPVAAMPPPIGTHTIPTMLAKKANKIAPPTQPTRENPAPPHTQPQNRPARARNPKLCHWWLWEEDAPGWMGDTPAAWEAKATLCNPGTFKTPFAKKHRLTAGCSGDKLRRAVMNSTTDLPPPKQLLVLTYAHQFGIERISDMQAKRDYDGEFVRRWKTHWAHTQVLDQHAEACHKLGFPLQQETKQPGTPNHLLHWAPLTLDEVTIEEIVGEQGYRQLKSSHANQPRAAPPHPLGATCT